LARHCTDPKFFLKARPGPGNPPNEEEHMDKLIRPIVAVALLAACARGSNSGEPGSIEGTVIASGQALTVSISGTSSSTTTDATGAFALTNVPAGTSELHVSGGADDATAAIPPPRSPPHRSP